MKISLRKSIASDLDLFFLNQADEEAYYMAAFSSQDPNDKAAYIAKWSKLLVDDTIHMQTILVDGKAIGCVVKFMMNGEAEITYALDKKYWGKGITTKAVQQFLAIEKTRPINGAVAFDNFGSQKVLEKVGFKRIGQGKSFAQARGKEIEEYFYQLK